MNCLIICAIVCCIKCFCPTMCRIKFKVSYRFRYTPIIVPFEDNIYSYHSVILGSFSFSIMSPGDN